MRTAIRAVALFLVATACSTGSAVQPDVGGQDKTGLEGTVRRGPTQPVCRVGESCDAPVQGGFTLQQDGRSTAHFTSDSAGHFLVYTPPGSYFVVPDEPIGIGIQSREVTVQAGGLTHIDLMFDTGIR